MRILLIFGLCFLIDFSQAVSSSPYLCDEFPEAEVLDTDDFSILCVFKQSETGLNEISCESIRRLNNRVCVSKRLDAGELIGIFCSDQEAGE